jgi:multidrug efflux pump subunit AcrA (membrane-fusion protein)
MRRAWKVVAAVAAVGAIGAGAFAIGARSDGDDESTELLIVPRAVERRTLSDVLTINGDVRREETQTINLPVDGKVSSVAVEDGDTVEAGDPLFALDGRTAVAVDGDFAFFRTLDVGSDGPDVLQLESILDGAGYTLSSVDSLFTEETRRALAAWQIERGYGGATPEPDETITVSLSSNSAGYSIGKANTVAFTVVPSLPSAAPATSRPDLSVGVARPEGVPLAAGSGQPAAYRASGPTINVSVDVTSVDEGGTVTFTLTADVAPTTDLTIDLTIGGDATGGDDPTDGDDYGEIDDTVVLRAGQTSVSLITPIYVDQVIEDPEDITVALTDQFGNDPNYVVGPTSEARVQITRNGDDLVPVITLEASGTTVSEGQTVTIILESTVESNRDLDLYLELSGSAGNGRDYVEVDAADVTLTAGSTTVSVDFDIKNDDVVERDETLRVAIIPDPQGDPLDPPYVVGEPGLTQVIIKSDDLPELTIFGGGNIGEGSTGYFTIQADANVTEDTSINYQISGTAQSGSDFETLTGTVIMSAGTNEVSVPIHTIDDDVVFLPSDMVVADWPARVGTVNVDEGEFVLQGSTVLTLTEPVFTITLAVTPSDRAELEVGQVVEVGLEASGVDLPGVIATLDDAATVDDAGGETYEGTVEVTGDFDAVDGAKVTIEVTLAEAVDVIAVPVAAVLRTATGDQVRVVNDQGTISRVDVTIGLIDGEWVEIRTGLRGDELVIVDIDPAAEPAATDD